MSDHNPERQAWKARMRRVAGRVAEQRRERGWSQAELARRANISRNVVNMLENETRMPLSDDLTSIFWVLRPRSRTH